VALYAQTTQVITVDMRLTWDQAAANLAEAQSMRFTAYVDGAATGTIVVATCQGSVSPFKCGIANPATAVGSHTVAVASQLPLTGGGFTPESRSVVCSFRVVVPSAAPTNLQFVRLVIGALGLGTVNG
jgi:hypothetical protein